MYTYRLIATTQRVFLLKLSTLLRMKCKRRIYTYVYNYMN